MKKWMILLLCILLTLLCTAAMADSVQINKTNFPDANFMRFIQDSGYDKNNNHALDTAELEAVTEMKCNSMDITDLTGIEYFTRLKLLWCDNNELNSLDLTGNTELEELEVQRCTLSSLDVSRNTKLVRLDASNNSFNSLDVSKNPALKILTCRSCKLTSLNTGNNPSLTELYCNNNQLASLDVSKHPALNALDCHNNQLTSLDVSKNPELIFLDCYGNQISSLDVSNCSYLVSAVEGGRNSTSKFDFFGSSDLRVDFFTAVTAGSTYSAPDIKLITVTTNGHGTARASGESGQKGDVISLSATPDKGYVLKQWKVISGNLSVTDNTFTIGDYHVEIQAVFEGIPYSITVKSSDASAGTAGASAESAVIGTEITLTATPAKGYQLKEWKVLSGNVTVKNSKFTMGTEDVVILAVFEAAPPSEEIKDEVTVSGGVYKLNDAKGTAVFTGPAKKTATKLTVKDTVSANGKTYKVTEIKAKACRGMKKLTTVTIGKNVTKIGKQAFEKCAKLKKVTIKNAKMKKAGFGMNCFKGINAKAAFKVPKKVLKNYTAWIRSRGKAPKTAKIKK